MQTNALMTQNMRIVLEKPVGRDYESARAINDAVGRCFAENQIFRIDHYLGKETVQNLLALRFGNSLFEPLWRREVIDHVQITVAEEPRCWLPRRVLQQHRCAARHGSKPSAAIGLFGCYGTSIKPRR